MNDSDLEAMLKAARPPVRSEEAREAFTTRVMERLHRTRAVEPEPSSWLAPLAWGAAVALGCVVAGFVFGRAHPEVVFGLLQKERQIQQAFWGGPTPIETLLTGNSPADEGKD